MQSKFNLASDWSDAVSAERNSIVFENKNKAYGAFIIRNNYERNLLLALLLSGLFFAGILILPNLFYTAVPMIEVIKPTKVKPTILTKDKFVIIKDIIIPPTGSIKPPSSTGFNLNFKATKKADVDSIMEDKLPINTGENSNTKDTGGAENPIHVETVHVVAPPIPDPNKTWVSVQQMPVFPGGEDELFRYLGGEIHYPAVSLGNNMEGTVYVSFVVNQDGGIGDIKLLRGVDNFLNDEAIRVVKKMPKWKPGKQNGNPVRVQLNLPVKFEIRKN